MMAKLGDICSIVSGTTPKSNRPEYWDGDINWVTPAELNDDSDVIYESQRKITEQAVRDSSLKPFPVGTVLLSSRAPIGKVAIAGVEMYCNQGFKNLICSNRIYNRYLYHFLKNSTEYLNSLGRGATFKEISKSIVENIEIPLPPLDAQRRIAAVLDKVSGLIAKRREQLDKLDELVKARFVEMFGDPVLNPMDWPTYHLADMADIVSGITKGRKTKEQNLIEVPYMAVSNVKDGHIDWTTIKTILATQSEIDQYRLLPDDVLMTEGGDPDKLGRGAIIQKPLENCIHQNHIFRVRLNENVILPVYFAEFLQHQKAKQYFLRCAKQTTGIASINMTQLKELPTLVPPRALQKDFTNTVERINKSKLTIQQSLDKLEVLKKALIQQYFGRGDEGVLYKLKAFQAGEYFHQASANIIPDDWLEDDDSGWFVPSIVNMAFACELYLKSLLSNGTSKICGHNLYKLYKKLPDKIKTYLQSNTSGYADDTSFEDVLKKNATVFEDWRYYFEEKPYLGVSVLFLESLANVLHSAAEKECK